jgi:hypothetical protein
MATALDPLNQMQKIGGEDAICAGHCGLSTRLEAPLKATCVDRVHHSKCGPHSERKAKEVAEQYVVENFHMPIMLLS